MSCYALAWSSVDVTSRKDHAARARVVAVGVQAARACADRASEQRRACGRKPVQTDEHPVRDPFELDEASDDPAAALESMKHNCCDEMPAEEVRAHTDDGR